MQNHVKDMLQQNRKYCHVEDEDGLNALHWACLRGMNDMLALLLLYGADPAKASPRGWTGLHYASIWGHVDVLGTLIDTHRIDVNATNSQGETALVICCLMGHHDAVKLLLYRGLASATLPHQPPKRSPSHQAKQQLRQCKRNLAKARTAQDRADYTKMLVDYKAIKATLNDYERVHALREERYAYTSLAGSTILHRVARDLHQDVFEEIMEFVFSM